MSESVGHRLQDADRLGGDFRADAVAAEDRDARPHRTGRDCS